MDKKQVRRIIQNMAQADLLKFLIGRANLTNKEQSVIECRMRQDRTQEDTAEQLERSTRWVQEHEDAAVRKLIENWSGIRFLEQF